MDQATHNKIVSFIWSIADDVLRDLFKRGKYPDVILPMCVIRRMDAVLEATKDQVLATKKMLDQAQITEQQADPLRGYFAVTVAGKPAVVGYEPDSDLRDTEQVPLLEEGGIEAFIRREVWPYTPHAWIKADATRIGYEVSFTRHFYKPQPLRTLEEIAADILAIEKEAEGLLRVGAG